MNLPNGRTGRWPVPGEETWVLIIGSGWGLKRCSPLSGPDRNSSDSGLTNGDMVTLLETPSGSGAMSLLFPALARFRPESAAS